jgi:hypothetical protein
VTDSESRRRIGVAAAAEVRSRWLWPHIVKRMCGVYGEATHHYLTGLQRGSNTNHE